MTRGSYDVTATYPVQPQIELEAIKNAKSYTIHSAMRAT